MHTAFLLLSFTVASFVDAIQLAAREREQQAEEQLAGDAKIPSGLSADRRGASLDEESLDEADKLLLEDIRVVQERARKRFAKDIDSFGDGVVVAAFMDSFYMETAEAWSARLNSMGYINNVIFALDVESFITLKHTFEGSDTRVISYYLNKTCEDCDKIPPLVGLAKFDAMDVLVSKSRVGIITEADVYWFKDPAPYLLKAKAPIVGSVTLAKHATSGINIGFVRVRPNNDTAIFLSNVTASWYEKLVKHFHSKGGRTLADQNVFNEMLAQADETLWSALDVQEFQLHDALGFHHLDCENTVAAHFTFFTDAGRKMDWLNALYANEATCEDLPRVPVRAERPLDELNGIEFNASERVQVGEQASAMSNIRVAQDKGRQTFGECFKTFQDHVVVATFMDSKYLDFAKPWAMRLSSMGYVNLAFFAFDDESVSSLRETFKGTIACVVPYVLDEKVDGTMPPLVGLAKLDAMEMIVRNKRVGIVTEADVFWMKSPKASLSAMQAPLVGFGRQKVAGTVMIGPDGLNMGFLRVRPDEHLLSFLKGVNALWLAELEKDVAHGAKCLEDQNLFNSQLQKSSGNDYLLWSRLDTQVFALHEWEGWPLKSCESLAVVHLTDLARRDKIRKLQSMYSGTLTCEDFILLDIVTEA